MDKNCTYFVFMKEFLESDFYEMFCITTSHSTELQVYYESSAMIVFI